MEMQAWTKAMEYIGDLTWFGLVFEVKRKNLIQTEGVVGEAVAVAIAKKNEGVALTWLDQRRTIAWQQLLRLLKFSTPLEQLPQEPLILQLSHLAGDMLDSDDASSIGELSELDKQKRHCIAEDLDKCLKEARMRPEFKGFKITPGKDELLRICQQMNSRIIIINMAKHTCDALCIQQGRITNVVSLGKIYEIIQTASRDQLDILEKAGLRDGPRRPHKAAPKPKQYNMVHVLQILWQNVVHPVLQVLGCNVKVSVVRCSQILRSHFILLQIKLPLDQREHITWCATGPLASVPLDWAGPYDGQSPNLRDLAISSFIPFISALQQRVSTSASTSNQPKPSSTEILVFTEEHTLGHSALPGTKVELNHLKKIFTGSPHVKLIEGDSLHKESIEKVIQAIGMYTNVHLACHGSQKPNPLKSAFHLTPGNLTMDMLMRGKFEGKKLAFCSACQTAQGDEEVPDEHLYLAASMKIAGFDHVIGTRWSIKDDDAPAITNRFYRGIFRNDMLDYSQVAHALHVATWEHFEYLTQEKKLSIDDAVICLAAYIHVGSRPMHI
ncbi:hypothetical protein CTheo_8818 [Ceratobasidium theobromae]|uniref:CHAT domain-containing protein n=1 Tax=Ceratobasidium theobromae TaxID=1582974 RepID=A0A5N5Q8H9_9AGAM|nr:hypothetical protein CTheo_8818 [Ceratobasidium theobromae]